MSDGIEVFFQDIRSAFRTALMGIAGLPSEIEWEGRPFTPPATGPFMRENLVPVGTLTRGGGPNGLLQHRVMLAVNLFYPSGSGTLDAEAAAGKLLRLSGPGRPSSTAPHPRPCRKSPGKGSCKRPTI